MKDSGMEFVIARLLAWGNATSLARFWLGTGAGFVLVATAWTAMYFSSLGIPMSQSDRNIAAWYSIKEEIASDLKSPKIVLCGGSNVLFGLSARRIQEALGIPAVNFGTHAALNLDYLFYRVARILKPGDIVILSLEWSFFHQDPMELSDVGASYLAGADPAYFRRVVPLTGRATTILAADWERVLRSLQISRRESARAQTYVTNDIRSAFIDGNGDYRKNEISDRKAQQKKALAKVVIDSEMISNASIDQKSPPWKRIEAFINGCRSKNIRVLVTFPSMMDSPDYRSEKALKRYRKIEKLFKSMGATILTSQPDTLYPREAFFDTFYHLTSDMRARRTEMVIAALKESGIGNAHEKQTGGGP